MRILTSLGIGLSWLVGLSAPGVAAAALVISSPQAGAFVTPGQLVTVSVDVTGSFPNGIAVVGGSPSVMQGPQPVSNPTFSITIPINAPAGPFGISAVGTSSTGTLVQSAEVLLDVEHAGAPATIAVQPARVHLNFVGNSMSLDSLTGTYADGSQMDLRLSSEISVFSSNSAVAVFQNGRIIAAGPGSATLIFSVGGASQVVIVTVPNSIRGDLNGDGRVDNSDVAVIQQVLNTPDALTGDARDLNADGQITSADITILKTLCTEQTPLCSTK